MYTHLHLIILLPFGRGIKSQVSFAIKERYSFHSLLCPILDELKLLQMFLDHASLKLETKEKRLGGTINEFDVNLRDHRQDHQFLLMLNGPNS
jgi:hypothetical protein